MSKNSSRTRSSVADIIQLFQSAPEHAFKDLIASGHYLRSKHAKKFWDAYMQLDHHKLNQRFSDSVKTFNKVVWLKLFYDMHQLYESEKGKRIEELVKLNPDEASLAKSFFLCLELGEASNYSIDFPKYSEDSLAAIKVLFKEILPSLTSVAYTPFSVELVQISNDLIKIQVDIAMLFEIADAFVWADFEMRANENSKGFILGLSPDQKKKENLFILNHLKSMIKRNFKRKEAHPRISEEDHFKKYDSEFKTDEGLATVFINKVKIISQTEGTTSIQVEENFFEDLNSEDASKRDAATTKLLLKSQEQNFHYQFRNALSRIYQPNDEIDIHALHIEIDEDTFVSLYELICAMSCLIAMADAFRYLSDFSKGGSIKSIKQIVLDLIRPRNPSLSEPEIESLATSEVIHHFKILDEEYGEALFLFLKEETFLAWFRKIEELKSKSQKELKAIIKLFSSLDSPIPFNPLYKIEDKYYFSYASCVHNKFSLNQFLYDTYVSDKLFNPHRKKKHEKPLIDKTQKGREIRFTNSLKELLQTFTTFVEARLEFGDPNSMYDFGDLKGEFDVIAYFDKENVIIPIQVKLSNVSPRSEKRKEQWIANHIAKKGIQQVAKDVKLLESKSGLRFVADKLGCEHEIKTPLIYPLIVSDNFFADHLSFPYNEKGDAVSCVSYFELKHLLLSQKVHDNQSELATFEVNHAASYLIKSIESNSFWEFLNEFADNFDFSKSLVAINDEVRIEIKI